MIGMFNAGVEMGQVNTKPIADDFHDPRFNTTEFGEQVFQRFHHITQIGFGCIVKQRRKLDVLGDERHDHQTVLRHRVERFCLPIETALVGEAVSDILDGNIIDARLLKEESVA